MWSTCLYNRPLLEYLQQQYGEGQEIYLATAADRELAEQIAAHLGIFAGRAGVGWCDESGGRKQVGGVSRRSLGRISATSEMRGRMWSCWRRACRRWWRSWAVRCVQDEARQDQLAAARFEDRGPVLKSWLKAIRLHQWAKNMLIFVPLLLAHQWHLRTFGRAITAFFSFGMCASATYIINDLLDMETDRRHLRKRHRPFAAGDLSAIAGVMVVALLMAGALVLALALPQVFNALPGTAVLANPYSFLGWLGLYTVVTLSYSLYLKRKLLLDVFVLSGLYTLRIMAGSAATGIPMSPWLAGFGVFFFLSLAFVKRFSELEGLRERGGSVSNGRGYFVSDLEQLRALGTGAMYAAVVVLSIYINNPETNFLYKHPVRLWVVVPVLLLWLSQMWMLASRGEMHDDPVVFAITDKRSLLLGVLMAAVIWWAL